MFQQVGAIAVAMTLGAGTTAVAATFTKVPSKDGKTIVVLNGEIDKGDADSLKHLIKTESEAGRTVHAIRLNSAGGKLVEGIVLAAIVKSGKMATSILNEAKCASACFIVFAAGTEKFASYGALVGVHGASDKSGRESGDATVVMARVVKELGVPPGIIGKMVVTPPNKIVWLSADDLRSMGTKMTGTPDQAKQGPAETVYAAPSQPDRAATATIKPLPNWADIVSLATKVSARQNNGTPRVRRACQPELKLCTMAILYVVQNGTERMVRVAEDLSGRIVKRELCEFNRFGDVRTCIDYDSGAKTRSMKNPKGDWIRVAND
jgi:hypothetical protein